MIGVLLLVVGLPGPDTKPHVWALWHDLLAILLLVMGVMCFLGVRCSFIWGRSGLSGGLRLT
jgi:hypothetical protein